MIPNPICTAVLTHSSLQPCNWRSTIVLLPISRTHSLNHCACQSDQNLLAQHSNIMHDAQPLLPTGPAVCAAGAERASVDNVCLVLLGLSTSAAGATGRCHCRSILHAASSHNMCLPIYAHNYLQKTQPMDHNFQKATQQHGPVVVAAAYKQ